MTELEKKIREELEEEAREEIRQECRDGIHGRKADMLRVEINKPAEKMQAWARKIFEKKIEELSDN